MSKNKISLIRIIVASLILATTLVLGLTIQDAAWYIWLKLGLCIVAYLIVGYDVLWRAVTNIFHGQVFDENFLMTVASIGAFGIGEYFDASAVMLLYQIGELFQHYAVGKSRQSISALMDIRPESANVIRNGEEITLHPSQIAVGEVIIVKAGEKIPLDGIVKEGECNLDTSAITGESLPRKTHVNQQVISGSVNLDGVLYVTTTTEYDNSTVSKILDMVENASLHKAPAENFITKFSKFYTPIVVCVALLLAVIPPLIEGYAAGVIWAKWIKRSMMFLFVSCPCALVISVPMGFFGGIASSSKRGILVKGSNYLEKLCKTNVIAFDKTGTLTKGNFAVTKVYPEDKREQIIATAVIAEQYSNHPIALSICKHARATVKAQTREIAGKGIEAVTDDNITILCGNAKLMDDYGIDVPACDSGATVYVAKEGEFVGYIVIADEIKDNAEQTVRELNKSGCKTVMLTGDNSETADRVARELNITEHYSNLLPQDKVYKLEELKSNGCTVAFVGDGINDAPVLATADIGVAMGAMGSDVAIETADIVLMHDDLATISTAKQIAQKTLRIVRENIVFSLLIKFAVLIISALGVLDSVSFGMIIAILADVGVCVLAILNSMRAMTVPKAKKRPKAL